MEETDIIMGYGSFGQPVADLQRKLFELGYPLTPTGVFDLQTYKAVSAYQATKFASGSVSLDLHNRINNDVAAKRKDAAVDTDEKEDGYSYQGKTQTYSSGMLLKLATPQANYGDRMGWLPDTIVIQGSGTTGTEQSLQVFTNSVGHSTHYLVDEEEIYRFVDPDMAVWHSAGGIVPHDLQCTSLDLRSISITVENFGPLRKIKDKFAHSVYDVPYEAEIFGKPFHDINKTGGFEHWTPYPDITTDAVIALCLHLRQLYPIRFIYGASEVARELATGYSWRSSPGPAFPMNNVREAVLG